MNTTTANPKTAVNKFVQWEWILAEIVNVVSIAIVTWVSVALIVNGRRTGKWRKENVSNVSKVNAGAVYTAAVGSFLLSYLCLLSTQATFNIGYNDSSRKPCEVGMDLCILGYLLTIVCVYIFLWFRQRSIYQHPAMDLADKAWLRYLNWGAFAIIICGWLLAGIAFVYPNNYTNSNRGCISIPKDQYTIWPVYVSNVIALVGQGLMLFLFLYPLRLQTQGNNARRIIRILKRSAALATICVASDLVAMMILVVLPANTTRHVTLTVYTFNLMVNIMSVLLSFESWSEILKSVCSKGVAAESREASSIGITGETRA